MAMAMAMAWVDATYALESDRVRCGPSSATSPLIGYLLSSLPPSLYPSPSIQAHQDEPYSSQLSDPTRQQAEEPISNPPFPLPFPSPCL